MENASKALIIAAAILLSILIIALGMSVYNNAKASSGNIDLTAQEISSHNAQFEAYEGRQKGREVRTLLNTIYNNNSLHEDRFVKVYARNAISGSWNIISCPSSTSKAENNAKIKNGISNIINNAEYMVKLHYGSQKSDSSGNGYITIDSNLIDKVDIYYAE